MNNYNPFSLKDKIILITGASSGIGRQCAIDCSKMGAKIALFGRDQCRLIETLQLLTGEGHKYFSVDLLESEHIATAVIEVVEKMGSIDGLVNCAGISGVYPLKLMREDKIMHFVKTNFVSAIVLTRECLKKKHFSQSGGSVVFISSIMGIVGDKGKSLYSATKGALIAATKSLACEFSGRKIRINCISPGAIVTPINEKSLYMADAEQRKILEEKHLLGFGQTSDIASGVIYLLSDASRWITGQNLVIDGGYTCL